MDPHSRLSQFNQRTPKSGPPASHPRYMDNSQSKKSYTSGPSKPSKSPASFASSLLVQRPIATNSRIKQDEKLRNDMFLTFINSALQDKANGMPQQYDELVEMLSPKDTSNASAAAFQSRLRAVLQALSHVVSRLESSHSALVQVIVNMPWLTMDNATVKAYTGFMGILLSARPEYLSLVLGKIAEGFTHQSGPQVIDETEAESSTTPLTRRHVYDRLHYLLRHILSLIPTLPSTLMPLLIRNFPHKRQKQVTQSTYIRNLLRVSCYCPELSDKILSTILDRAIQIDVEIQVELEELEDEDPNAVDDQDIFELDPFDTVVGQEPEAESDSDDDNEDIADDFSDMSSEGGDIDDIAEEDVTPMNVKHVQDMVQKLDTILSLVFDHFSHTKSLIQGDDIPPDRPSSRSSSLSDLPPLPPMTPLTPSELSFSFSPQVELPNMFTAPHSGSSSPIRSYSPAPLNTTALIANASHLLHSQFHTLLSIFDRTILRTFKSRYTQFILFWFASLDVEFSDTFQGMLIDTALFQPNVPTVTRSAAASYIASLVSRARFVDRASCQRVVGLLCSFLSSHLDATEEYLASASRMERDVLLANTDRHSTFYAVCQAVFLIFCFRWRDLSDGDEATQDPAVGGRNWIKELITIRRVVSSVLNPLKFCSPHVAGQFARVSHVTGFLYCYNILESNKPSRAPTSAHQPRAQVVANSRRVVVSRDTLNVELTTFFPFDPCKLRKVNAYIEDVYRDWASVAIDEEQDDDDDEEEEEEDELEEDEVGGGMKGQLGIPRPKPKDDAEDIGASFGAMSISPVPRVPVITT